MFASSSKKKAAEDAKWVGGGEYTNPFLPDIHYLYLYK